MFIVIVIFLRLNVAIGKPPAYIQTYLSTLSYTHIHTYTLTNVMVFTRLCIAYHTKKYEKVKNKLNSIGILFSANIAIVYLTII